MFDFFDTFFIFLKYFIRLLLILPLVMFVIGFKTKSRFFRELAIKLFIIGISLAIILTLFNFFFKI